MADLFFLTELAERTRGTAPGVRLAHPFLLEPIEGRDAVVRSLSAAQGALDMALQASAWIRSETAAAIAWRCGVSACEIEGVTLALLDGEGRIGEVRIAVRPVQCLEGWRERLQPWLANQPRTWALPLEGLDASDARDATHAAAPVHRRPPFPLSDDVAFHGPAFTRPVRGLSEVSHVLAHAGAVYGECEYGLAMRSGTRFLRVFRSKALPLEIVSIARLDADDRIVEWTAFMQPWPSMIVFRDRLRARLAGYLDDSFYERCAGVPTAGNRA